MTSVSWAGKAAAEWLGDLRRSGSFEEADLEELQSHLEDQVRQLVEQGLSEKEAFWVAMSRLGDRNDLPSEYAKTNSRAVWRHRFWWMAAGLLGYLGFNYLISYLFYEGTMLAGAAGVDGALLVITSLLLMTAVNGAALLLAWRLLPRAGVSRTASRLQRIRQGWKGTVLLYVLCLVAAVFLVGLGLFGWYYLPHPGPDVTMAAQDEYILATAIFAALFAVALVSAAFVVSRPRKTPGAPASHPAKRASPGRTDKKYPWALIAGVCLAALLPVAAVGFIVRVSQTSPAIDVPEGHEIMVPAHWWQAEMTEQQMATLSSSWGEPINAAQLLDRLWPGVLQQMPEEARAVYEHQGVNWSVEGLEGLAVGPSTMCAGSGVAHDDGQWIYFYYVGSPEWEDMTLEMNSDRGFAEDRQYRVSLYISEQ